jgi:hypothetical protein
VIAGLDRDEHGDAEPDFFRRHQCDAAQNHAVGFQPLQPLPARRRGQSDALADLGNGERGVLLHHGENLAVDGVHSGLPALVSRKSCKRGFS